MILLLDGGNAFEAVGRINKADVLPTFDDVKKRILDPLKIKDAVIIGSAGKKPDSGDIDVGASVDNIPTFIKAVSAQAAKEKIQSRDLGSLGIISLKFPIHGSKDEFVQVDLMPTTNLKYLQWSNHSPTSEESKYKGAYRNILLIALARVIDYKVLSKFPDGSPKVIERYSWNVNQGLQRVKYSYEGTNKQLKNPKKIASKFVTNDPKKMITLLLGKKATLEDTNTFEMLLNFVNSDKFAYPEKRKEVKEGFMEIMKHHDMTPPKELNEALEKRVNTILAGIDVSELLNEATLDTAKMRSIPHFHQMTIRELMEFLGDEFAEEDIEVSVKSDGVNGSITAHDGKTFYKSKKSKASSDPNFFYNLAGVVNPAFKGMGDLVVALNDAKFPSWLDYTIRKYKKQIVEAAGIKTARGMKGLSIFGELFNDNAMNTLVYSKEVIGEGAFVVFGCVVNDGTQDGIDISTTEAGKQIMNLFVREFNGISNWHIFYKQLVNIKFSKTFIKALQRFVDKNADVLKSKKRDARTLEAKEAAQEQLETLLRGFKKDVLDKSANIISALGGNEIEGLVLRNMKTGAITKMVDLDKFSARNKKNWEGNEKIGDLYDEFRTNLVKSVLKNADIFQLKSKQLEKLGDYLLSNNKKKFSSIDEVLDVLYKDASGEVEFDQAEDIADSVEHFVRQYMDKLEDLEIESKNAQRNPSTAIDEKPFSLLLNAFHQERLKAEEFANSVRQAAESNKNPLPKVIAKVIGGKAVQEFTEKFVTAS